MSYRLALASSCLSLSCPLRRCRKLISARITHSGNSCSLILRATGVSRCIPTISTVFTIRLVDPEKEDVARTNLRVRRNIVATKPSLPGIAPDRINHSRTDPQNHFNGGPPGRPSDIFLPEIYDLMSWFLFA
jgi:hypothetical protein